VIFVLIPNIELVTFTAFLGGSVFGVRKGLLVAALGEAIFSAINPIGSGLGYPILYLFQIISIGGAGMVGGLLSPLIMKLRSNLLQVLSLGIVGFLLTFFYDVLTGLSLPLSTGIMEGTIWGSISTGIIFYLAHMISNTAIFSLFGLGMLKLTNRQLIMHGFREN
jgi:uncharacterized membrane protein